VTRKLAWLACLIAAALVWARCGGQKPDDTQGDQAAGGRTLSEEERLAGEAFDKQKSEAPIKKTGEHTYTLDGITVDTKARQIRFGAVVNQTEQDLPLEVIVCTEYGKTHESLFRTTASPTYLNVAFQLIGCKGGKPRAGVGNPNVPVGSPVEVEVKWKNADGKEQTVQPEAWIWNHVTKKPMAETHWTYTGSIFHMGRFMAQSTGTIINIYIDPSTLVEPPIDEVNDDTVFGVYEKAVPPKETPVEIIITALPEEKEKPTDEAGEGKDGPHDAQ
jgi:hypothetical protein